MKKSFLIAVMSVVSTGLFAQQSPSDKSDKQTVAVKTAAPMKLEQKLAAQPTSEIESKTALSVKKLPATEAKGQKMKLIHKLNAKQ